MTPPRLNEFRDPAARNYLVLGLAAVLVISAVLFVQGGLIAAIIPAAVAALGLLLRWTAMPIVFLVTLSYFLVFPYGIPDLSRRFDDIYGSHLRVLDIALVGSVLAYLAAQYRLYSLVHQSMPFDMPSRLRKKSDRSPVRPGENIADGEVGRMFATIGLCVFLGQIAWFFVSETTINFLNFPPFEISHVYDPIRLWRGVGLSPEYTRFLLTAGLCAVVAFAFGLALRYWRLVRLSRDEARMILLDTEWSDARRELNRQEKWRAWALPKFKLPNAPESIRASKVGCGKGCLILLFVISACVLFWCVLYRFIGLK